MEGGKEYPSIRTPRRSNPRRSQSVVRRVLRGGSAPAAVHFVQGQPRPVPQHPRLFPLHDELLHCRTVQYPVRQRVGDGGCHVRTHHRCHAMGCHIQRRRLFHLEQYKLQVPVTHERYIVNGRELSLRHCLPLREHRDGIVRTVPNGVGRTAEHEPTVHCRYHALGTTDGGECRVRNGHGVGRGVGTRDGHHVGQSRRSIRFAIVRHGVSEWDDRAGVLDGDAVDFVHVDHGVDVRGAG
mmetsp:Transcript_19199/g.34721  ORF Transcript_19199/g.34721 Transcript_19199/m.34721 type:complete len:239 (+) Transcript_19199:1043-1759(+)